jgi:hypothetical protein
MNDEMGLDSQKSISNGVVKATHDGKNHHHGHNTNANTHHRNQGHGLYDTAARLA